ncbi:MAG TPA: glutathione S-transferase C-terminal domain-containing protein [Kofleriaceae bacterium]|jgi:putative glutathione S-transferase
MGKLVDGVWQQAPLGGATADGAFHRGETSFREHVKPEDVAPGRYHLYAAYACPWAHRTLITRALRGLEYAIGVTMVDPHMGDLGWTIRPEDPDPYGPSLHLSDVYVRAVSNYTGKVTVPVLWDSVKKTIVNNESREVMRIFDLEFAAMARNPLVDTLAPEKLRPQIEQVLDEIYQPINNGVYRAGFARTQEAYEKAVNELFAALAHWDDVLGKQPYTCGDTMTEADIALFTTCLRFDLVYYSHMKCNVKRLRDHVNLWRFTRRMYQVPAIRATCNLDEIKTHYYWSQDNVNPTRIVPVGPSEYPRELDVAV